jgi:large subunit ribosomal protein L23
MGIFGKKIQDDEKKNVDAKSEVIKVEETVKEVKKKPIAPKEAKPVVDRVKKTKKQEDEKAYKVISFPLISEKATDLAALGKYVFVVPMSANKSEVRKVITNIYGVEVTKLNIIKKFGKKVRQGRKFGKQKDSKKVVVTLAPGQKIEVYEGV